MQINYFPKKANIMKKGNDKKLLNTFIKRVTIIIGIKIIIIFFFFINANKKISNSISEIEQKPNFCFNGKCINLEIAKTPQERELGLMFREELDEDKWMLFIYNWPWNHSMRMRNTLIPLDIIRISTGYKVVDFLTATPCKEEICPIYKTENDSLRTIEVNSWIANKLGLKTGDIIELNI